MTSAFRVLRLSGVFRDFLIHALLETGKGFCHRCVEGNHGRGAVDAGTRCTELEAVAGEGKGRRAVTVGIINDEVGNLWDVNLPLEV